jgi:prepilin-type N-terminal cleavage/methylation domain-containing protein/prepilin-type processing-associated H-X9-DG protein
LKKRHVHRTHGFTLIELVVVITVVTILTGLFLAGVNAALEKSRQTRMLNQLRQMGLAAGLYMTDNDGQFPQSQHQHKSWIGSLPPYMGVTGTPSPADLRRLFLSPVETVPTRTYSYAINDLLTPRPNGDANIDFSNALRVSHLSETILFAPMAGGYEGSDHYHFASDGFMPAAFKGQVAVEPFGGRSVYLFADGHVETLAWSEVQKRLTAAGSCFVHPAGESSTTNE